jgi:hypothetical protein
VTRTPASRFAGLAALWAGFALLVVALSAGLRHDAFFAGDSGVKLIAARHAAARPDRPLTLPLPTIGGKPVPFISPFFARHGDHAHAVTPEALPLASAPLLARGGVRAIYALPAAGFLLAIAGCAWLALVLDERRSAAVSMTTAGLGTPLLFYGLEFWEHAVAVGFAALATALLVKGVRTGRLPAAMAAGALLGAAIMFRPEGLWYATALLAALPLLGRRTPARMSLAAAAAVVAGASPMLLYSMGHFRTLVPLHLATNAAGAGSWLPGRWHVVRAAWASGPIEAGILTFACFALAVAAAVGRGSGGDRADERRRNGVSFLWTVAAVFVALVIVSAPNDGGAQWGPRYMLFAYIPLSVLAAEAVHRMSAAGVAGSVMIAALLAAGVWSERAAYRFLRGAKQTHGRIVDFVVREVPEGGYVATDLWWLDQVAAAAAGERTFLYAGNREEAIELMRQLGDGAARSVTVVTSRDESALPATVWAHPCFAERRRQEIPERTLTASVLHRAC